jgi:hypothetical protein
MLPPEYLEDMPDEIVELYAQAERDILADMARRINQYDYWIPAADWQNQKLLEAGRTQSEILNILAKATKRSVPELKKLMEQAAKDNLKTDIITYEAAGKVVPTFEDSAALREILTAGYKATAQTMKNLTQTTARTATQQFERALDKAWMKVTSGAFSSDAAINSAIKELCAQGVKSVRYPSGHEDTLEVAVRRAVLTGVNKTCCEMSMALIEEFDCDLVEVSAHAGARTGEGVANHAEWQGKVYRLNRSKHSQAEREEENVSSSQENRQYIGKSLGAKAKNYDIYDPQSGYYVHLAEDTYITQPKNHVMAGKGRDRQIDCIDWLVDKYGGDALEWTKEKGFGSVVDSYGETHEVELHWYQEPSVGKVEMKIKRWE